MLTHVDYLLILNMYNIPLYADPNIYLLINLIPVGKFRLLSISGYYKHKNSEDMQEFL